MELAERERHLCLYSPLDTKHRKLPEKRPKRSTSSYHPAKHGRGRIPVRPVGRPPIQRRSTNDLLTSYPQTWTGLSSAWSTPAMAVTSGVDGTGVPVTTSI